MERTDTAGIPFSRLKGMYRTAGEGDEKNEWLCYGALPDGRLFGVKAFPAAFDPWEKEYAAVITDRDGVFCSDSRGSPGIWHSRRPPEVMAASPSGRTFIWYDAGRLAVAGLGRVTAGMDWEELNTRIPGGPMITDACIGADGLMTFDTADGEKWACYCDGTALLRRAEDGMILWRYPADQPGYTLDTDGMDAAGARVTGLTLDEGTSCVPASAFSYMDALLTAELPEGLETIEALAFESDIRLRAIRIPAGVGTVGFRAFGGCETLRELVIEGDPARLKNWDERAFEGCPCERQYLDLRARGS